MAEHDVELRESDLRASVPVPRGLHRTLRVLHVSDSHVSCGDGWMSEREAFGLPAADPIHTAYTDGKDPTASSTETTMRQFREQVTAGVQSGADLIVHTGDLLNIPSEESVAFVHDVLVKSGLPFFFISGNHDWCYEGLGGDRRSMRSEAGRQAVRAEWRTKRLAPLFPNGKSSSHWSEEIDGLVFLAVDNSTCMVGHEQHSFYRSTVAKAGREGKSVVLLLHVPLFLPELKVAMAGADGEGYYCGDVEFGGPQAPDEETVAFVETVVGDAGREGPLCAILAGHIHSAQVQPLAPAPGCALQFVTEAGCNDGYRIVDFVPTSPAL